MQIRLRNQLTQTDDPGHFYGGSGLRFNLDHSG